MNSFEAFAAGIAPQHVPALVAACLLPVLVFVVRRLRPSAPILRQVTEPATDVATDVADAAPRPDRASGFGSVRLWAAWALGVTAAVHLALPLGHSGSLLLTAEFVGSGAAYAWLAMRAWEGRSWRLLSALLLVATLIAYLVVIGGGTEEPDQVGIATALVELFALGLCLVPSREPGRRRRFARFAGSTGSLLAAVIVGAIVWVGSFAAHTATNTTATAGADAGVAEGVVIGGSDGHTHGHDHAARAQAGVIMRPLTGQLPTAAQRKAADELASATRISMARFASLDAALAAGYVLPQVATGPDVHLSNKAYASDGHVLDPERPETLVYAIEGGRATLLGVVYVMERAGVSGPTIGGPITRWHAHNVCLTLLPPGFGVVSPFGSCPALSINLTSTEMMHVWVVDNPAGPFAEGLDKTWVGEYNAAHGRPFAPR